MVPPLLHFVHLRKRKQYIGFNIFFFLKDFLFIYSGEIKNHYIWPKNRSRDFCRYIKGYYVPYLDCGEQTEFRP